MECGMIIGRTSLPVPQVFSYCSEASNPVGTEWLIMEHMSSTEMGDVWDQLRLPQKSVWRSISLIFTTNFPGSNHPAMVVYITASTRWMTELLAKHRRSPRWAPLSPESLRMTHNPDKSLQSSTGKPLHFVHCGLNCAVSDGSRRSASDL